MLAGDLFFLPSDKPTLYLIKSFDWSRLDDFVMLLLMNTHKTLQFLKGLMEKDLSSETDEKIKDFQKLSKYLYNNISIAGKFEIDAHDLPKLPEYGDMVPTPEFAPSPYRLTYYEILNYLGLPRIALFMDHVDDEIRILPFGPDSNKRLLPADYMILLRKEDEETIFGYSPSIPSNPKILEKSDSELGRLVVTANLAMTINSVIACSNIEYETVAAPKYLNRKRVKKGKLPVFEYKKLKLHVGEKVTTQSGGEFTDRSSPRFHLRRGHIRKLPSGNQTWVSPCAVGDISKGRIEKEYKVIH